MSTLLLRIEYWHTERMESGSENSLDVRYLGRLLQPTGNGVARSRILHGSYNVLSMRQKRCLLDRFV